MSARPSAGSLVWAGFDGAAIPGPLLDGIARGRIGGLLLFALRGNIRSAAQVRGMLGEAVAAARRGELPPVPVAVDQEGGTVIRIGYRAVFPSAMAIGATGDPAWAERAAAAVARGLRADGIAVNHAPVCDVNTDPRNPVIGIRAFGDDPETVARFAAAWVRGSEGAGVATTPKHFPGHGATPYDTHHTTVDVRADRATLDARELAPFRAVIAAGASGMMSAHIRYPALDDDWIATLSPRILTDLLRGALGFDGLTITDSLDMSGVTQVETPDQVVARAIRAGVDAAMVTTGLEAQLGAGERIALGVPATRILEAIRRMSAFRARFGIAVPGDDDGGDAAARVLSREIAARSITMTGPALPDLHGDLRVTAFAPGTRSPVEELATPVAHLEAALRHRVGSRLRYARDGAVPEGEGPIVVCTSSAVFDPAQAARARELLAGGGVLCALRSPYDATLLPGIPALLTYGDVPVSLDALADVLAGRASAPGRLPVRLPA
ncbi:MAG TPA: glycoside hydrolase family 3 N-terminal domain-containing protein [Candidatus Saccharimonadales bacterium]|nr:glycoside hydrolase family 3 N-terminal domain-containing protein [Candidatus Saccharimonadales bacterium]